MMKIAFHTLGCKVNQYETQALKEKFLQRGYEIVGENDFADVYVINTCTVTGLSDRKSRQFIRRVKKINPDSITAVIGCYAQVSPDEARSIEGVNIVAGTNEKNKLPDYIEAYAKTKGVDCHIREWDQLTEYEETGIITSMDSRTRAFIKIQEGCDRFCSYCIIPYARGTVRSRGKEEIVKEAESLIGQGFKELVLTGINTALYGMEKGKICNTDQDNSENPDMIYGIEIIVNALNELPGDFRIRLGSLEPNVIDVDYARRLLKYERLCPHMHLSLQSGSDRILKEMNRIYDRKDYLQLVHLLKEHDPGYGITTDIIVGFPGETEEDYGESRSMIEQAGFCKVHVFKYSKREGTRAAEMKAHISPEVKARRSVELIRISDTESRRFYKRNLGTARRVLLEQYDPKTGLLEGLTDNYIKVYCKGSENRCNTFADVRLIELYRDGVKGEVIG
ncbi:MAG: tRNA (N(6)-L-threonylcarbamoyladenosine(37)-C(2))-methylthiotransferase MtaB [Eubacteriales bacterium]|nr:tRNA (N(6)-L-threonylcarbamoyladenosine(37)-C(2))-methylthiotransferase MtaB [Eubacteriales bacterium]